MAEILNLRRARKAKTRQSEETRAAANRVRHGTPKKLREAIKAETKRVAHTIEGHKLEDTE